VFADRLILFNLGNQWSDVLSDVDSPVARALSALGDELCLLMQASAHDAVLAIKLPASVT
jgi:hypothetical protein